MKYFLVLLCSFLWQNVPCLAQQQEAYTYKALNRESKLIAAMAPAHYGDAELAIEKLESYIDGENQVPPAYHQLAKAYIKTGNYNAALPNAQKAARLDRTNRWYPILVAEILSELERFTEAAETYGQIYQAYPDELSYGLNRAFYSLKAGEAEKSLELLKTLEENHGKRVEISDKKILVLQILQFEEELIAELETRISLDPRNPQHRLDLAEFYYEQNAIEKARDIYEEVLHLDPENKSANKRLIALQSKRETAVLKEESEMLTSMRSESLSEEQKIALLIPYIQKLNPNDEAASSALLIWGEALYSSHPQSAKSTATLADINFYTGNISAAVDTYKKTLDMSKSVFTVWEQYFRCLRMQWDFSSLQSACSEALAYFPNRAALYRYLGESQFRSGASEPAMENLNLATVMSGRNIALKQEVQALKALANGTPIKISELLESSNTEKLHSPIAFKFLIESVKTNNGNIQSLRKEGTDLLVESIKEHPDYFATMAYAAFLLNEGEKAEQWMEKCTAILGKTNPEYNVLAAKILRANGEPGKAQALETIAVEQGYKSL